MNLFTKHPESVGETYLQHMLAAIKVSGYLFVSSVFQLIHAVFPFVHPPLGTDVRSLIEGPLTERAKKIGGENK